MYSCSNKQCNNYRENHCLRGGPRTANSVEGEGPGAVCYQPPETIVPDVVPVKEVCKVVVKSSGPTAYRSRKSFTNRRVC